MSLEQQDNGIGRREIVFRRRARPGNGVMLLVGGIVERAMLLFAIVIFCGAASFGRPPVAGTLDSNPVNFYANVLILLFFGSLMAINLRSVAGFLPRSRLLLLFIAFAVLSVAWSIAPGTTLRKLGTLASALLVALYMTSRFEPEKSIKIIGHAFLLVVGLSVLVALIRPDLGVMQANLGDELAGNWKGILAHKNSLGWITIAGAQVYAWRLLVEPKRRGRHAAVLLLIVFAAIKSQSATALVAICFSLILVFLLPARRFQGIKRVSFEWALVGIIALAVAVLVIDPVGILAFLGKDASLTGRVPLWGSLLDSIGKHPVLGYGYGAFWLNSNPEMMRIWALNPWQPPDAHDAYIEMALDLGLIGAVLASAILVAVIARSLALCKRPDAPWAIYFAAYAIVYAITCLVETLLLRGGDIHCFLLPFCYFSLLRHAPAADSAPDEDRPTRNGMRQGWLPSAARRGQIR